MLSKCLAHVFVYVCVCVLDAFLFFACAVFHVCNAMGSKVADTMPGLMLERHVSTYWNGCWKHCRPQTSSAMKYLHF